MAAYFIRCVIVSISTGFLFTACTAHYPLRACPGGFNASFVQMAHRELRNSLSDWKSDLGLLRSAGIQTIVLQYSGDDHGSYDNQVKGSKPIRSLLEAAQELDVSVLLGLYRDPSWPKTSTIHTKNSPPLDQPSEMKALAELCNAFRSCAGWLIPQPIDMATWGSAERTQELRSFLERTSQKLRNLTPGKPIAIASFFTGELDPQAHAEWWSQILTDRPVDMLMFQDGVGTGRGTAESAQRLLAALWPITDNLGIALWAVVEVFHQIYGPPLNNLPFEAVPADLESIIHSIELERSTGARLSAFTYLKYMDPMVGPLSKKLHTGYADWCDRNAD
jgi:hypothetical protein